MNNIPIISLSEQCDNKYNIENRILYILLYTYIETNENLIAKYGTPINNLF